MEKTETAPAALFVLALAMLVLALLTFFNTGCVPASGPVPEPGKVGGSRD